MANEVDGFGKIAFAPVGIVNVFGPVEGDEKLAIGGIGDFGEAVKSTVGDDGNKYFAGEKLIDEVGEAR